MCDRQPCLALAMPPPGVLLDSGGEANTDSGPAPGSLSNAMVQSVDRKVDRLLTGLRVVAQGMDFSTAPASVGRVTTPDVIEAPRQLEELERGLRLQTESMAARLESRLAQLGAEVAERLEGDQQFCGALEEAGTALATQMAEVAEQSLFKIMSRMDTLIFKADAILGKMGGDLAFENCRREAAASTCSGGGNTSSRNSRADSFSSMRGPAPQRTRLTDYLSEEDDDFEQSEMDLTGGLDDLSDDTAALLPQGRAPLTRAKNPASRGAQLSGTPAQPPAPPDSWPSNDTWLPAAHGMVAPGSRVFILQGTFKGRAATLLAAGPTTGLRDGCNLRLDGAVPGSQEWCCAKTLAEIAPRRNNERVRLPKDLSAFQPGRKGPKSNVFFRRKGGRSPARCAGCCFSPRPAGHPRGVLWQTRRPWRFWKGYAAPPLTAGSLEHEWHFCIFLDGLRTTLRLCAGSPMRRRPPPAVPRLRSGVLEDLARPSCCSVGVDSAVNVPDSRWSSTARASQPRAGYDLLV